MSLLCRKTMRECPTPGMCGPFDGCSSDEATRIAQLEKRVVQLERTVRHLCPDKSDDI